MSAPTSHTPKWETVLSHLEIEVRDVLKPHDPLPSERDLMVTFGVSRMTIREALRNLVEAGAVYRVQGSGTFVAEPSRVSKSLALTSFTDDIRSRGMRPGATLVSCTTVPATPQVAGDLGLRVGVMVINLVRVRTADEASMCLERVWIPADLVAAQMPDPKEIESLYDVMAGANILPTSAEQTITADVFDDNEAALLHVPEKSPCLRVARIAYDTRGRAVERGHSAYRADRYDFRVTIRRPGSL